ncbi:MAG TPA: nitroreductase family protein [Myxococcota bacterium]|nr:nitroreductase family protein [Myxococcota bacterium]
MILRPTTVIDAQACNGCGLCVKVCPDDTLSMQDGKAKVTGDRSFYCDHCAAICPSGAIEVKAVDSGALDLTTVENRTAWLPYGKFDAAALVQLMRSRRSSRMFLDRPVARETLEDLVKIGSTAPSGTNCQLWTFTILPDRRAVMKLGAACLDFFSKLNRMAASGPARLISRLFMKDVLGQYFRDYYETVENAIAEYKRSGRDRLFHGAPALIIIGMKPGATCPCEDALLAAGNILLAAHAMGFGTCLIGFAVEAIKHDKRVRRLLQIPKGERVYAVVSVGKTREWYKRPAGRMKVVPRYWNG